MTQNEHFAKPIALPKWPILKIVLFLEYLMFFGAVFCTELLYCARRIDFCMFFGILIFDPKRGFCEACSLAKMADFQNRLISRIFGVFLERFFAQNYFIVLVESIFGCFLEF